MKTRSLEIGTPVHPASILIGNCPLVNKSYYLLSSTTTYLQNSIKLLTFLKNVDEICHYYVVTVKSTVEISQDFVAF